MPASYGAFGAPNFANKAIPMGIVNQYDGSVNLRNALAGFGNLAYGPSSGGLANIGAAQEADPTAEAYQTGTMSSGGVFGRPGEGTNMYSAMIANLIKNEATKQAIQSQSVNRALKGMADTGMSLADSIYSQQQGGYGLQEAQNQVQAGDTKSMFDLANIATDPHGMGANIMGAFSTPGTSGGPSAAGGAGGATPLSAGWAGLGKIGSWLGGLLGFGGVGTDAIGGGLADIGGTGLGAADLGSLFGSFGAAGGAAGGGAAALGELAPLALA